MTISGASSLTESKGGLASPETTKRGWMACAACGGCHPVEICVNGYILFWDDDNHWWRSCDVTGTGGYYKIEFVDAVTVTQTGNIGIDTLHVEDLDDTSTLHVGMLVTGTGIPPHTKISSIFDATTVYLTNNSTATIVGDELIFSEKKQWVLTFPDGTVYYTPGKCGQPSTDYHDWTRRSGGSDLGSMDYDCSDQTPYSSANNVTDQFSSVFNGYDRLQAVISGTGTAIDGTLILTPADVSYANWSPTATYNNPSYPAIAPSSYVFTELCPGIAARSTLWRWTSATPAPVGVAPGGTGWEQIYPQAKWSGTIGGHTLTLGRVFDAGPLQYTYAEVTDLLWPSNYTPASRVGTVTAGSGYIYMDSQGLALGYLVSGGGITDGIHSYAPITDLTSSPGTVGVAGTATLTGTVTLSFSTTVKQSFYFSTYVDGQYPIIPDFAPIFNCVENMPVIVRDQIFDAEGPARAYRVPAMGTIVLTPKPTGECKSRLLANGIWLIHDTSAHDDKWTGTNSLSPNNVLTIKISSDGNFWNFTDTGGSSNWKLQQSRPNVYPTIEPTMPLCCPPGTWPEVCAVYSVTPPGPKAWGVDGGTESIAVVMTGNHCTSTPGVDASFLSINSPAGAQTGDISVSYTASGSVSQAGNSGNIVIPFDHTIQVGSYGTVTLAVTGLITSWLTGGMAVTGPGIPAGTHIVTVDSGSQVTINNFPTSNGPGTLSFGTTHPTSSPAYHVTTAGCTMTMTPATVTLGPAATTDNSGTLTMNGASCHWSLTLTGTLTTITSATSGAGNDVFTFNTAINTGALVTEKIVATDGAGVPFGTLTLTIDGVSCTYGSAGTPLSLFIPANSVTDNLGQLVAWPDQTISVIRSLSGGYYRWAATSGITAMTIDGDPITTPQGVIIVAGPVYTADYEPANHLFGTFVDGQCAYVIVIPSVTGSTNGEQSTIAFAGDNTGGTPVGVSYGGGATLT
jgi:hypothetical protein